jgi:FSR family fosmidomycin resistance protein-like MFS transporter
VPRQSASPRRVSTTLVLALLAVELIDELVFGVRNAAWPMMRADLQLTYEQIGVLLSLPTIVGGLIEPAIGILGDTSRRRALLIGGGVVFACSAAATALVDGWIPLLIAFAAFNPASGAFVGLSQATLMDLEPERREQNMARWVVAGSLGIAAGTSLVTVLARVNGTWRHAFLVLGVISAATLLAVIRVRAAERRRDETSELAPDLRAGAREALRALARSDVRRWLILLECSNMMMDVLGSFLALYIVDVAGGTAVQAAAGVALFTGVGLAGDALLIPLLERVDGLRYLRASVLFTLLVFPALLIVSSLPAKFVLIAVLALLNSGWYSIPQARLYDVMPNQSGTVMTLANTFGLIAALVPLALGAIAQRVGLAPTMWLLLVGPLALLVGLPRDRVMREIAGEG